MNHSLPASTTTTVRLYALTHLHTHTPYYAIRNRRTQGQAPKAGHRNFFTPE
ncbi:unnamed protein product [Bathycoccus prasinos]